MGGAHGHISHLYEDRDITFRRMKDIFSRVGTGRLAEAYEKCDGINLFVTWDFAVDELRVARNKGHIKEGGLDSHGLELKFGNRPALLEAFQSAYDALSQAFGKLQHQAMVEIFGSTGGVWLSTEVIDPGACNTIQYDDRNLVFHRHGAALFDFDGMPLATNLERNMKVLQANGGVLNEALEDSDWRIHTPKTIVVRPVDESVIVKAHLIIDGICRQASVAVHETIRTYLFERLKDDFQRFPLLHPVIREAVVRKILEMPGAHTMQQITKGLDRTLKEQINQMIASGKASVTRLMRPIEEVVHEFGSAVMTGMHSTYINDGQAEVERLREHLRHCIDEIQNGDDEKGKAILERNLWKLRSPNAINSSMEGIVFADRSHVYKLTGAFAPANQICSYLKYGRDKPQPNRQSLASFIQAG